MAIGPRLELRQSQSLVMTPQLQQAIKLLALSNLEIESFIGEALESNPLLEAGEVSREEEPGGATNGSDDGPSDQSADSLASGGDAALDIDPAALDGDRETGDGEWGSAIPAGGTGAEGPDIDERGADGPTLAQHLDSQIGAAAANERQAFIARTLIGLLDEAGYLASSLHDVAGDLQVPLAEVEAALAVIHTLDPTGVGARSLSECLALQAREADRYDPCMESLIDNLDLVAKGDFRRLKRICNVDDEDFAEMLAELRSYDPKPGIAYGGGVSAAIVPDVLLAPAQGGWDIAINPASLPRLVVNRPYYLSLRGGCSGAEAKAWLREKLSDANWLIKALDQRQKTILKVTAEIVEQQEGFFRRGISELKPLTLRIVADAIEMHESTVSRVTSNKYLHCPRGTFELKYFFTSGVGSADGDGASSAAVKAAIRSLTDAEDAKNVLSDDRLVELLKEQGYDLARRTVAKYREAAGIGSSVQRRRQKKLRGL